MHAIGITDDDIKMCHAYELECITRDCALSTNKTGKHIETQLAIIDVSGLSLAHIAGIHYVQSITFVDQNYYPECLHKMMVINAPAIFPVIFSLVSVFLDAVTLSKMEILKGDPKARLVEVSGADGLINEYGGNDPYEIPMPSYEYTDKIGAGKTFQKKVLANWPASFSDEKDDETQKDGGVEITWSFVTVGHDISFGVTFIPSNPTSLPLIVLAPNRVPSQHYPIDGSHYTSEPGTWNLVWDNSYSYFTSKTLQYNLNVSVVKENNLKLVRSYSKNSNSNNIVDE